MNREEIKLKLYNYLLNNAQGKDNRVKGHVLMATFEIGSDRTLRKLIQEINASVEYKSLIGAISGYEGGYFIPITATETKEVINNRRHRADKMYEECTVMEWKANLPVQEVNNDFYEQIMSL